MWLTFALKNWKYIVMGLLLVVIGGLYLMVKAQGIALDKKDAEISVLREANHSNTETIKELRAGVTKANNSCAKRIQSKDALIEEMQRIDSINNQGGNDATGSDNPLIIEFIKLYSGN